MSVGMPRTPYFIGVCGFSSMLIFATVTLPFMSAAISSRKGAIILQGPHHSAQKSTRTGFAARSTSASNELSVTLVVALMIPPRRMGETLGDAQNGRQGGPPAGETILTSRGREARQPMFGCVALKLERCVIASHQALSPLCALSNFI